MEKSRTQLMTERLRGQEEEMEKPRSELIAQRLRALQAIAPDIEASAVVSADGLIMASALPAGVEEDRVSAMSAAMLSLGERIVDELGQGKLQQVQIRGGDGYVILSSIGEEAVLTVMTGAKAKLGLVLLDMSRAARDLGAMLLETPATK